MRANVLLDKLEIELPFGVPQFQDYMFLQFTILNANFWIPLIMTQSVKGDFIAAQNSPEILGALNRGLRRWAGVVNITYAAIYNDV